MQIPLGAILTLRIKYHYQRDDLHYYQRKIPLDVVHLYNGQVNVKINLKTTDIRTIALKISNFNQQFEAEWEALRNNPIITPPSVRAAALKLLESYGLRPNPGPNDKHDLERLYDDFEDKAIGYVAGDEEGLMEVEPGEFLSQPEQEALRLLNEKPQFRLTDAINFYLDTHIKKNNEKFCNYQRRAWGKLISVIGNIPFQELNRDCARRFVNDQLTKVKTTTVDRNVTVAKAVTQVVIDEKEIDIKNPFQRLKIGGLGEDSEPRGTLNTSQLKHLSDACLMRDDDIRWMIALQTDLGCRIAEVAGLALEDFHLDEAVPYVSFKVRPWRGFKNKVSPREVPLVGMALWAAKRIVATSLKGQEFAFPRYTDYRDCRSNSASAAVNKFIRSLGIDMTSHSMRHTMRDRLRNVNAPKPIQDSVGGWAREDIGDSYGLGYSLDILRSWLIKVVRVEGVEPS